MWERFADIVAPFLKENAVPFGLSFVAGVGLLATYPQAVHRLPFDETVGGLILLAAYSFAGYILVASARWVWRAVRTARQRAVYDEAKSNNRIRALRVQLDSLDKEAYSVVYRLVIDGNKPLKTYARPYMCPDFVHYGENKDGSFTYELDEEVYSVLSVLYEREGKLGFVQRDIEPARAFDEYKPVGDSDVADLLGDYGRGVGYDEEKEALDNEQGTV